MTTILWHSIRLYLQESMMWTDWKYIRKSGNIQPIKIAMTLHWRPYPVIYKNFANKILFTFYPILRNSSSWYTMQVFFPQAFDKHKRKSTSINTNSSTDVPGQSEQITQSMVACKIYLLDDAQLVEWNSLKLQSVVHPPSQFLLLLTWMPPTRLTALHLQDLHACFPP